ncbi:Protein N-acetyltransferase, RimJ/RimL family [Hydrobacter penzbergensis]|uniref:Protein N-acetyltransferase, RimJ/RimL family n=1 Tax=Hydrobacter penzbergensis TaxID=1235997 RepID=A0A8X8LDJ6_9BACT|nr:GNAT family N-acetyltransferase [Hydrobacter penzbergensis]SDW86266.1 Protein N-acetyltransferase, RimJ/RimL family [Hydrobacter penzbergensis]
MTSIPFIKGAGIYLRELNESDLNGSWYSWLNDQEVTKFQNKGIFPNTREKQKQYLDYLNGSKNDVAFAIVETESNKHIGNVGLHHIDWVHHSAELGIVLGEKSAWGKKYGKQSWQLITEYGFNVLNLHRIYAQIMEGNIASCKSAESAGFVQVGFVPDAFYKNGQYIGFHYYNRIRTQLPL